MTLAARRDDARGATEPTGMGARTAAALVFGTSAAVLVVELVALRLLAPYLGLTLETNTLVIGVALTAIALGSWLGGRAADATDPRRLLGPAIGVSGAVVALTPATVRSAAEVAPSGFVLVALGAILVPGALLSAVTPIVTKLRLTTLEETGTVVGRLSGIGTAGAIVGTVLTGFVLISRVPVGVIMVGLGVLLLVTALLVDLRVRGWSGWSRGARVGAGAAVVAGGLGVVVAPGGCDVETTYHCARVVEDPADPDGRTLVLDGLRHSYVDLADPTRLDFEYVRALAAVADASFPAGEPIAAQHLGAGGATLPRYLAADRPGTRSVVSEIDGGVVQVDLDRLGLETGPDLEVRVEDARLGLGEVDDESRDLVVGDAFGGVSVPWHLATVEMMGEVDRVLDDDGVYAANVIDHAPLSFARAEVATLAAVFDHVALLGPGDVLDASGGGNMVVVASDAPLPLEDLAGGLEERETQWGVLTGDPLRSWVADADVLTDDFAPVDQLLTPYGA
ncbi:fused MFS/spermidine synthase [Nocardioides sp. AX2bis]|uniref:fused MFS/spermidine synthase n=1 Tax=Nocardioides sp. AX2bis TaxID=2653157 RepID=UPI0012F0B1FE|nr:fused MFS/spermidine synthase [Nocardioides sp. AX2bis]VXC13549.1 Spermine synthase [Nocardioides sp. AX2bis]